MPKNIKPYLLLAPAVVTMLCVFAAGLTMGFVQSLGYFPALGLKEITLRYYREVFSDPAFTDALVFSLYTSLVSSLVSLAAGLLLAYALIRSGRRTVVEQIIYKIPIIVPHIVAAFLIFSMMGQSGYISRIAFNLGVLNDISEFPALIFDRHGIGIIAAYVWKEMPFVALVVFGILRSADSEYAKVAENLGASSTQAFFHVVLPMCFPTLLTTFIIIFSYSFGAFEVPFLLGPTSPKALPVLAYVAYTHPDLAHRPYAMAINMVIAALTFIMVLLYSRSYAMIQRISSYSKGEKE